MPNTSPAPPSSNTQKAYAADWAHFSRWCRLQGVTPLPPNPACVARYLMQLATEHSLSTIKRRLAGLQWNAAQRGLTLNRTDPLITEALATIIRTTTRPQITKAAIGPDDIAAMVATLPFDLRGLRDRAILLVGFAARLRRSDIVALDCAQSVDSRGWIEVAPDGLHITRITKTGQQTHKIPRDTTGAPCPVAALETWLRFAKIAHGPVFRRISRNGTGVLEPRLSDKHVVRLIKATVLKSGIRPDLPEAERLALFSGQSLRNASATKP